MPTDPTPGQGHPAFYAYADELKERHRLKSGGYGTGSDPFANFTTVASSHGNTRQRWEYACDRMVEKIARINSLTAQGRFSELREEFRDLGGLAGCCDAMLQDDYYDNDDLPPAPAEAASPPPNYLRVVASPSMIDPAQADGAISCERWVPERQPAGL